LKSDTGILFVEPERPPLAQPLLDWTTRTMAACWRRAHPGAAYKGFHVCSCGACSSSQDHYLPGLEGDAARTNSLCVHYLAYHRHDLTPDELGKAIAYLAERFREGVEPVAQLTVAELQSPLPRPDHIPLSAWPSVRLEPHPVEKQVCHERGPLFIEPSYAFLPADRAARKRLLEADL
jgi:hypothetical protein